MKRLICLFLFCSILLTSCSECFYTQPINHAHYSTKYYSRGYYYPVTYVNNIPYFYRNYRWYVVPKSYYHNIKRSYVTPRNNLYYRHTNRKPYNKPRRNKR
jgi:hypothetical protein